MAPILMLIQSGSVFQILLGRDTGWQPQRRDDGSIPCSDIVRRHRWHTLLGAFAGPLGLPDRDIPVPVDVADHRRPAARHPAVLAQRPARRRPRPEAARPAADARGAAARRSPPGQRLQAATPSLGFDDADAFWPFTRDPRLREQHEAMLPPRPPPRRDRDRTALAEAKLVDAETIEDAAWLKPKERMVVLHDRALLSQIKKVRLLFFYFFLYIRLWGL